MVGFSAWLGRGQTGQADYARTESWDYLIPRFVLMYLPTGVRALIFAAILAAAMSSLSGRIVSALAGQSGMASGSRGRCFLKVTKVRQRSECRTFVNVPALQPTVSRSLGEVDVRASTPGVRGIEHGWMFV